MNKILIVDDNEQSSILLERLLKSKHYEVTSAKNGVEALKKAQESRPDMIVSDVLMAGMDGFELCRRLKTDENFKSIPFLIYSATYIDPKDERFGLDLGADRYIIKPQEPQILLRTIQDVFNEYQVDPGKGRESVLGEEIEFFRRYNEVLFRKLEKKMTDLTRLNEERSSLLASEKKAREEADKANRAKDIFLGTLAHELRTPLTSILNWAQLLQMGKLDQAKVSKAGLSIQKSVLEEKQILDDLFDVSKIASHHLVLNPTKTDLAELVSSELQRYGPSAKAKDIKLTSDINVPKDLVIDQLRTRQILDNLLKNAIKFTLQGGSVHIAVIAHDSILSISVTDSGIGIAQKYLQQIFEPFWQIDSSTTRSRTGLGMGLYIVKNIVNLMNGSVWAESKGEGKGSTFHVELPVICENLPNQETSTATQVPTIQPQPQSQLQAQVLALAPYFQNKSVLIVDDDPGIIESLAALFRSFGIQVRTATSAASALSEIFEDQPDILISDIAMPGEDGYSLIKKVRKTTAKNPSKDLIAVALTAYADKATLEKAVKAGYDASLPKPVDFGKLLNLVASIPLKKAG